VFFGVRVFCVRVCVLFECERVWFACVWVCVFTRINPDELSVIAYDIVLESTGDGTATGVKVTDELREGAVFESGLSSGNCNLLIGANTVECIVGNLTAGEISVLTITISIIREQGDDILNDAIVEFLNEFGEVEMVESNVYRIRVGGGGGGGGGCSVATGAVSGMGAVGSLAVLLIPVFAIGIRRLRRKIS